MKIPKYWAKGEQSALNQRGQMVSFSCWHWSDISPDDARQQANKRAGEIVQKLLNNIPLNRYIYGDRPLREEVLQSVKNVDGQEIALVTRNLYGAKVLNATKAMFIDIDFPEGAADGAKSVIGRLFGKPPGPSIEEQYTQKVANWAAGHNDLGIRVYRTLAGLRCLITNQVFDPTQSDSLNILRELNSDPLYIKLCQAQECFRARLTPKPWRCGIDQPPSSYPFDNSQIEASFRQWEAQYSQTIAQYAACRFVTEIGSGRIHPDVEPVLKLHDQLACSPQNLKLA